jgi:hypothetical protein
MEVYIPQWLADRIREKHGSLEEYRKLYWNDSITLKSSWEQQQAWEVQTRVNERLSREWKWK